MACIKFQLYIILLQFFVFVNSEGRNSISTLCRYTISLHSKFQSNIFVVPTAGCDAISSGGMCYNYFGSTNRIWVDARQQCTSNGYDLATITSLEENSLLVTLNTGSSCWIGLNDIDNEGTYVWADGTASTYTHWTPGEPSGGSEDCTEMYPTTGNWNDKTCSSASTCYFCSTTGKVIQ